MQSKQYQLFHGECLTALRELASGSVDAVITDPPYCSGAMDSASRMSMSPRAKYQSSDTKRRYPEFTGDNRDQRGFAFWATLWLTECVRVAKPGAPFLLFTDWRQLPTMTDVLQAAGVTWRGVLPWVKPGARPAGAGRFKNQAEYVIWGSKGPMPAREDVGYLAGYFQHSVRQSDKFHVTGKPTELMRELVRVCSPGGIILDPFMGSGTTGVAAVAEGRGFIGIEYVAESVAIARDRIEQSLPYLIKEAA